MDLSLNSLVELPQAAETFLAGTASHRHFAFYGEMGAGKTTFIKALCKALGAKENVTSPTFALINEYTTRQKEHIYHFDFYRIKKIEELYDLGAEEYFQTPGAYCFIEWPELAEEVLPDDVVKVYITVSANQHREIHIG